MDVFPIRKLNWFMCRKREIKYDIVFVAIIVDTVNDIIKRTSRTNSNLYVYNRCSSKPYFGQTNIITSIIFVIKNTHFFCVSLKAILY